MLPPTNGAPPEFGPMYDHWDRGEDRNQLKRACSNVSGIFINSKCYTAAANHDLDGYDCTPNKQNFEDFEMFGGKKVAEACKDGTTPTSVFLSIVQDFGPRRKKEGYVNILPQEKGVDLRHADACRQIVVILKELGPNTYTCLRDSPPIDDEPMDDVDEDDRLDYGSVLPDKGDEEVRQTDEDGVESPDTPMREPGHEEEGNGDLPDYSPYLPDDGDEELGDGEMARVTKCLRMLRTANLGYLDDVDEENLSGIKDFLPGVYVGEDGVQAQSEWETGRESYERRTLRRTAVQR